MHCQPKCFFFHETVIPKILISYHASHERDMSVVLEISFYNKECFRILRKRFCLKFWSQYCNLQIDCSHNKHTNEAKAACLPVRPGDPRLVVLHPGLDDLGLLFLGEDLGGDSE